VFIAGAANGAATPLPAGDCSGRYAWWVIQVLALSGPVVCDPWVQGAHALRTRLMYGGVS